MTSAACNSFSAQLTLKPKSDIQTNYDTLHNKFFITNIYYTFFNAIGHNLWDLI